MHPSIKPTRRTVPAATGTIDGLRVIKWKDDHFEATWTISGRRFSMFFDPIMLEAKGGRIEWRYADGSRDHRGNWKVLPRTQAGNIVALIFRLIAQQDMIREAVREHHREVMSPDAMRHRKSAREANALQMYSALQTIQKLAGYGRPKGDGFGLNERERMEILQLATSVVSQVDTWREDMK
jgi:hypothetical protein